MKKKEAIAFIVNHVQTFPELHKTPAHLVNTYSAMGGHPIRYCKECVALIDKFKVDNIPGIKKGMWHAYYKPPETDKKTRRR